MLVRVVMFAKDKSVGELIILYPVCSCWFRAAGWPVWQLVGLIMWYPWVLGELLYGVIGRYLLTTRSLENTFHVTNLLVLTNILYRMYEPFLVLDYRHLIWVVAGFTAFTAGYVLYVNMTSTINMASGMSFSLHAQFATDRKVGISTYMYR